MKYAILRMIFVVQPSRENTDFPLVDFRYLLILECLPDDFFAKVSISLSKALINFSTPSVSSFLVILSISIRSSVNSDITQQARFI